MPTLAPAARRGLRAATLTLALGALLVPSAAHAEVTTNPAEYGLYGSADPTYDGAFRQSLGLLAHAAAGTPAPGLAVSWLYNQQCADGGWQAYRGALSVPCGPTPDDPSAGEDSNSTAIAVQALAAIGQPPRTSPVAAMRAQQNADGGWGFTPGSDSDPNSTALMIGAITALGQDPSSPAWTRDATPLAALAALQVGCGTPTEPTAEANRGGLFSPYTDDRTPDLLSSTQGTWGLAGAKLPVGPRTISADSPTYSCTPGDPTTPKGAAAGWLVRQFGTEAYLGGANPNPGQTAQAVIALTAAGYGQATRDKAAAWLLANGPAGVTGDDGSDNPGELGYLVLALHSAGIGQTEVGQLVTRLDATIRQAPAPESPGPPPIVPLPSAGPPPVPPTPTVAPTASPSAAPGAGVGSGQGTRLPVSVAAGDGGQRSSDGLPAWQLLGGLASVLVLGGAGGLVRRLPRRR